MTDGPLTLTAGQVATLRRLVRAWEAGAERGTGNAATEALVDLGCEVRELVDAEPTPIRALVLVTRDPDGPGYVDLWIEGKTVREPDVVVVDAGRGWEWEDWTDARDAAILLARAHGPTVAGAVRAAHDDPPGGMYVEGKPDDEPWI
jgi:hypothetical protein